MIHIYDPREAQDYRFHYFEGGQFSSLQSGCLVVSSKDPTVYENPDLLLRLILTFSSELICINALIRKWQFIRRPKLEKTLGRKSDEKGCYFASWEYSDVVVEHIMSSFREFAGPEQWTFGLFSKELRDEVDSLRFTSMTPFDDFQKNIHLFDYIVCVDLSDYWFQLIVRNEKRFDDVIKFFEDSGL